MSGHDFALIVFGICVALISQSCTDACRDSPDRRCMLELVLDFVMAVVCAMVLVLLLVGVPK